MKRFLFILLACAVCSMFLISCGEEAPDTGIENQGRVEEEIETTGTDEESALDAERDPSSAPKGMKEAKEEGP